MQLQNKGNTSNKMLHLQLQDLQKQLSLSPQHRHPGFIHHMLYCNSVSYSSKLWNSPILCNMTVTTMLFLFRSSHHVLHLSVTFCAIFHTILTSGFFFSPRVDFFSLLVSCPAVYSPLQCFMHSISALFYSIHHRLLSTQSLVFIT